MSRAKRAGPSLRHGGIRCDPGLKVADVLNGLDGHVLGDPVEGDIDVGEQATTVVGHGDPLAVDLTHELVVGVPSDHQVDRIV